MSHDGLVPTDSVPTESVPTESVPSDRASADGAAASTGAGENAPATAPAAGASSAVNRRAALSIRDMAISMGVLVVPLVLVVLGYQWFTATPSAIDPSPAYSQARATAKFPIRTIAGLPSSWQLVSADSTTAAGGTTTLRLGYHSPAGGGARIVQSDVAPERLLVSELGGPRRPIRAAPIGATQWQVYPARAGETAYVLMAPKFTILVVGGSGTSETDLRQLVHAAAQPAAR